MKFQELQTHRLFLRAIKTSDVKEILFLRSDSTVNQFVKRQTANNEMDALNFIKRILENSKDQKTCYWCITEKNHNRTIGTICLWNFSEDFKKAEVGYDLHPDFHGKGIMSEALNAVLSFGFSEFKLNVIEAYTQFNNEKSVKLLKKNGFKQNHEKVDQENPDNIIFELNKQSK